MRFPFVAIFLVFLALFFSPQISTAMDRESLECLGCHDAAVATDVTLQVCSEPNCDHPFGIDYRALSLSNHGLKSPNMLPQPIKLVNNSTIGCGTCHVPFKSQDHSILSSMRNLYPEIPDPMLVIDNRQSQLCFGCHTK
ncbi:MAG: hypothetical protein HYV23_04945 [Deltaproteobacteria bacterium]|nr:hypothetical protein [Deltaproteobacteria bacterium]